MQDIGIDSDNEAIIQSTLTLASSLGKECIVEGVESAHQLAFLKAQGCSYFQGYLFSKAVPKEQVLELIERDWQPVFSQA